MEYSDEEIEQVRVKAVGEECYIEPRIIESARRRAIEKGAVAKGLGEQRETSEGRIIRGACEV